MTRTMRHLARFSGIVLAAGTIATIAPSANADTTPLTINFIYCETGRSQYSCYADISGGVGPITEAWSPAVFGRCTATRNKQVTVVVTDATGASVSDQTTFVCSNGPWP